jgi:hypothetical protein
MSVKKSLLALALMAMATTAFVPHRQLHLPHDSGDQSDGHGGHHRSGNAIHRPRHKQMYGHG